MTHTVQPFRPSVPKLLVILLAGLVAILLGSVPVALWRLQRAEQQVEQIERYLWDEYGDTVEFLP